MRIIPAIDIIDGKCVRLTQGDYSTRKVYSEDPLEMANSFQDHGIRFLHLVDLDGARSQCIVNHKVLEKIAVQTNLKVDFGGGLKADKDLQIAFECGANQVTVGSVASKNPTLFLEWLERYGPERIILGADCNNRIIATDGWYQTGDQEVIAFIQQYQKSGVLEVICTDIAKDGMLQGPAIALYSEIIDLTQIALIASGGVSSVEDLMRLKAIGCAGAIVGKALYEGKITLKELGTIC